MCLVQQMKCQIIFRIQLETLMKNGMLRGKLPAASQYDLIKTTCSLEEAVQDSFYVQVLPLFFAKDVPIILYFKLQCCWNIIEEIRCSISLWSCLVHMISPNFSCDVFSYSQCVLWLSFIDPRCRSFFRHTFSFLHFCTPSWVLKSESRNHLQLWRLHFQQKV